MEVYLHEVMPVGMRMARLRIGMRHRVSEWPTAEKHRRVLDEEERWQTYRLRHFTGQEREVLLGCQVVVQDGRLGTLVFNLHGSLLATCTLVLAACLFTLAVIGV